MNDQTIEQEIQAKGLTAPRVTPADIEAVIKHEHYFTANDGIRAATGIVWDTAPLRTLTFCVLELHNGFTVTGESACASPENFDAEVGRKVARQNAVNKIWPLLGYALKDRLAADQNVRQRPAPKEDTITFDAFVQYGIDNGGNIVNGMPWSFQYKGYAVTHENDQHYLICRGAETLHFTPAHVLATCIDGTLLIREA